MRSQLKRMGDNTVHTPSFSKISKIWLLLILLPLILLVATCDQAPTTLDEEPYLEDAETVDFYLEITTFEFDILSWDFFFTATSDSPEDSLELTAEFSVAGESIAILNLNDLGLEDDIQINDGSFEKNWRLPDSLSSLIDSLWILDVWATSGGVTLSKSGSLQPERPVAPIISSISHLDTLNLPVGEEFTLDTLRIEVIHPTEGRDSIRDVSFISLKPDSNYANSGNPILLHDDGGAIGYSGDKVAGDGIYSLILPLASGDQTGTYYWTFNARTWLGVEAEAVEDSLVVLQASGLAKPYMGQISRSGVFQ